MNVVVRARGKAWDGEHMGLGEGACQGSGRFWEDWNEGDVRITVGGNCHNDSSYQLFVCRAAYGRKLFCNVRPGWQTVQKSFFPAWLLIS